MPHFFANDDLKLSSLELSNPNLKITDGHYTYVIGKWALFIMMSLSILVTGCTDQQKPTTSDATETEMPIYKVLTDSDGTPFTLLSEDGSPTGFDIDLMNAIAEDQGFEVKYDVLPWGQLMPFMQQNKGDLAIGHISITDERKKIHTYSEPYFNSLQLALVKSELADLDSFQALKGSQVMVQEATIFADLLDDMGVEYKTSPNIYPMIVELIKGDIDAIVGDGGILLYYQNQYKEEGFEIIEDATVPPDNYGIIVKTGDDELLSKINSGLENLKQNGTYQSIYDKWFN